MSFNTDRTLPSSPVRLPGLDEFDRGVEALRRHGGQVLSSTFVTYPHPNATYRAVVPLPSIQGRGSPVEYVPQTDSTQMTSSFYDHVGSFIYTPQDRPVPSPDGEKRHIKQKYTTEEGDFLIYCVHDKKLEWNSTYSSFTKVFGNTNQHTLEGLQSYYYRMNQRVPLWDEDGWLIFEHEEDLEPKHTCIKSRERRKLGRPIGLAQRYPERAIRYGWVDKDIKCKCYHWAIKRTTQYREREERRKGVYTA